MQRFNIRLAVLAATVLGLGGAAQAAGPTTGVWRQIVPTEAVTGLDGSQHRAACSGFPGTDPTFSFWAKRGKSKNLVVYFEGGGACWNDQTCSFPVVPGLPEQVPQVYVPQVYGGPDTYDGIFNASHPANPVKDWSFVYIPYCTGDVHVGAGDRSYTNAGNPAFPSLPSVFQIHHGGYGNFMVVMDWVRKNVDRPEKLLVAGSSAGGYGASANFPWVQSVFPKARLSVLADASQGVLSRDFDTQNPGRQSWSPKLMPQVFGTDVDAVATTNVLAKAAASFPKARVAQFTTQVDVAQAQFHILAASYNPPGFTCPNPYISWNNQMVAGLTARAASVPNYRHYVAAGTYHTILRSPQMYSESSAGRPFTDWLTALVQGDDQQGGSTKALDNQACPGCLQPIACPALVP